MGYDKVCTPFDEGRLGISSMTVMNRALLMKLWWKICTSKKKWAKYLVANFFGRNGELKRKGIKSTILPGIRWVYDQVEENIKVLIGDGSTTSLYFDVWCANRSIASILDQMDLDRTIKVSDLLVDGVWVINDVHRLRLEAAGVVLNDLPRPSVGDVTRIWMPDYKGNFSVNSARNLIRPRLQKFEGANLLWRQCIHPTLAAQNWKILRGACATLDQVRSRCKIEMPTK